MSSGADTGPMADVVREAFGERCEKIDPDCATCQAWAWWDEVSSRPTPDPTALRADLDDLRRAVGEALLSDILSGEDLVAAFVGVLVVAASHLPGAPEGLGEALYDARAALGAEKRPAALQALLDAEAILDAAIGDLDARLALAEPCPCVVAGGPCAQG